MLREKSFLKFAGAQNWSIQKKKYNFDFILRIQRIMTLILETSEFWGWGWRGNQNSGILALITEFRL